MLALPPELLERALDVPAASAAERAALLLVSRATCPAAEALLHRSIAFCGRAGVDVLLRKLERRPHLAACTRTFRVSWRAPRKTDSRRWSAAASHDAVAARTEQMLEPPPDHIDRLLALMTGLLDLRLDGCSCVTLSAALPVRSLHLENLGEAAGWTMEALRSLLACTPQLHSLTLGDHIEALYDGILADVLVDVGPGLRHLHLEGHSTLIPTARLNDAIAFCRRLESLQLRRISLFTSRRSCPDGRDLFDALPPTLRRLRLADVRALPDTHASLAAYVADATRCPRLQRVEVGAGDMAYEWPTAALDALSAAGAARGVEVEIAQPARREFWVVPWQ